MNHIQILDCTLRDGGYCNEWKFGNENIKKILQCLVDADIDIIECGFLTKKVSYEQNCTRFNTLGQISEFIPRDKQNKTFVVMVNFGEYDADSLPMYDKKSVEGIRVAFHKKDMLQAIELCSQIIRKGYKVFVQPMVTLNYSMEEFYELLRECNQNIPDAEAFYIVDSFGGMKKDELKKYFEAADGELISNMALGFHGHNNTQMAYANAQMLVEMNTDRKLYLDTSVMGMGRGAGNLNTELFVECLNEKREGKYILHPLLTLIDQVINNFYYKNYWGYSMPNYLSAKYNTHPNYAGYLSEKNTLTIENMNEIFMTMEEEKRPYFDKEYMEQLYTEYMNRGKVNEEHLAELARRLQAKKVLIIAPGKSAADEKEKIIALSARDDIVTIEINFKYDYIDTDYLFLSNLRRYREIKRDELKKAIVTSNVGGAEAYITTSYMELLNDVEDVKDNAGMMLIKFLISLGVGEILVAGMDGYSHEQEENYADENLVLNTKKENLDALNRGMEKVLSNLSRYVKIRFVTEEKYINIQK